MNIAIVSSRIFSHGGTPRVLESWARILAGAGHRVQVLTPDDPTAEPFPDTPGVSAGVYPSATRGGRLGRLRGAASSVIAALEAAPERADLVIAHDFPLTATVRAHHPDLPILCTVHSPFVEENRLNNWKYCRDPVRLASYPATRLAAGVIERRGLRAATCVHTLSDYTWSLLRARHADLCRAASWQRIPGTFDEATFVEEPGRLAARKRLGLDPSERILLTVRRLVPRNGVDRILDCAERLRGSPRAHRFLIGGSGPLRADLEREIARRGLSERVRLLGFVPEEDLASTYQASDAFLLPTRDLECFGLPVIEAMACGSTPLVLPDGGPAETCRPFPSCIARENTTAAFVRLVADFVAGEVPPLRGLPAHARAHYSEEAVRGAILQLVDRLALGAPPG